ncbi:GntR family transcriptional regulator [Mycobacterium tuberculosis]|nr:GntR family transcriptional regulator [Mycobacterium tuberculosis]
MTEMFSSVERPRTAAAGVEQHLKELIRARRLVAGDRLPPERQLAERLGVNRSTLRSALQSLTEQGVIEGRQGAGWVVRPRGDVVAANLAVYLSLEDVTFDQLFQARRAIEPHIAASAARHRTDEQVVSLRACITAMRSTTDGETYLQADSDFHAILAVASHNPVFSLMITPTLNLLHDVRKRLSAETSVISSSHDEHEQILGAVELGDASAAESAMLHHIDRFVSSGSCVLHDDASD